MDERFSRTRAACLAHAIISAALTAETVIALAAASMTAGARVAGMEVYDVLSGSMEPAIEAGSLAYVNTGIACESIRAGDVIAFEIGEGKTVTHRVTEVDAQTRTFTTKGDANAAEDPQAVPWESVRGKVWCAVPKLGDAAGAFMAFKVRFIVVLVSANAALCVTLRFLAKVMEGSQKGATYGKGTSWQ